VGEVTPDTAYVAAEDEWIALSLVRVDGVATLAHEVLEPGDLLLNGA
jgi:hypothetical protein